MFIELLPDILRFITTSSCIIGLFFALSRPKYKIRVYFFIAAAIVIIDAVVCTLFTVNNKISVQVLYSIPYYVLITCGCKWLFKDSMLQWAFNCITVYIVYAIIFFASFYLGRLMPFGGYGTMVFRTALFGLIIVFFYKFLRPLYLEVSENWGKFILPLLGIFSFYIYLLLSKGDAYVSMAHNLFYYCFLTAITLLVYVAIIGTIFSTKKKQLLREENQRRKANEILLLSELDAYHEFVNIAKENRHDMRHHNAILAEYVASKDLESAKEYLKEYSKSIESAAMTEFCKNPLANAVLKVYAKRISDLGIEFVYETQALGKLPFTLIETSTVLSNILENALEATEKCQLEKKFIKLHSSIKDNKLILEVENSSDTNGEFMNGIPISTKEGGGTGLKSIKTVINNYNGLLDLKSTDGVFVLRLVVPIK